MNRACLILFAMLLVAPVGAQDMRDRVNLIFDALEDSKGATLHQTVRELQALGRPALADIRRGLARADGFVRAAAAIVLYPHERDQAVEALFKLLDGKNGAARKAAADALASLVSQDADLAEEERARITAEIRRQARTNEDPLARVALWRALWSLSITNLEPLRELRDLLRSDRRDVREEAALAMAEKGRFIDAKKVLLEMSREPGDRGRLARAYLNYEKLQDSLMRALDRPAGASGKYDFKTLEEAIDTIKKLYHDPSKVDPEKMVEAAIRGACASLDPYTVYMDPNSIKELKETNLEGKYGGIGARVQMKEDRTGALWLTIVEPIFSGPAYRAGLRTGDQIREVEGELTMNKTVSDVVKLLRGKPGTEVNIKVLRRGWTKVHPMKIVREIIQMETTIRRLLPGDLGYIRLTGFGERDILEVAKAIREMSDMKALLLDLRRNTGGYLNTAHRLCSYFLKPDLPIVSTRSRGVPKQKLLSRGPQITRVPMVVLVDEYSASASEILAGALQDHKRAIIVGSQTYGKGSVQEMRYLKTTGEKAAVKITTSRWYLPSGKSVEADGDEKGGVTPDIVATLPERDFWEEYEFERLRRGDEIHAYLKKHFDANRDLFRKLADNDGGDPARYPAFEELYASLNTKASEGDVRKLLREMVRERVQDEILHKPLHLDFQEDTVLQRAILEACKLAKVNPRRIKDYETFAPKPKKKKAEAQTK